jgi:hypothetical protein
MYVTCRWLKFGRCCVVISVIKIHNSLKRTIHTVVNWEKYRRERWDLLLTKYNYGNQITEVAMSGNCSRFGNVRLLNKIEREEHKSRRDLQELGHRWEGVFQTDLTEIKYEILTLMQVVRMGSGGGLRFENDKESSCITRKWPNVFAIWNYRMLLRFHKRLCH